MSKHRQGVNSTMIYCKYHNIIQYSNNKIIKTKLKNKETETQKSEKHAQIPRA
jgi:hypothetical protein